jgi:SAM-dependent methyltransferase
VTHPPLTPCGSEAEGEVRHRYGRLAEEYDRRWARYVQASVDATLRRIDLTGVRDGLDVGCGTGALLERAARAHPARFVGLDLSLEMLEAARRKLGPRAGLVAGSAARLPFRSRAFDLVVSTSALHHWHEPEAGLSEIRRVLRTGGRVAITDWCGDSLLVRLRDRALRRLEPAHGRVWRSVELAALLADAGFTDVRIERWRIGVRWSLMTGMGTASAAP